MPFLILLRHGQSTWNLENRFTGKADVGLTQLGEQEAKLAGLLLEDYPLDIAYTSELKRAIRTLEIVLKEAGKNIPIVKSSALNERDYGDLEGLNKTETEKKYGVAQVLQWRRSFDVRPPNGESLKDTFNRVVPYYKKEIEPKLKEGENILIVAHGNSLRALIMHLESLDETKISELNIALGIPKVYEFNKQIKLQKMHNLLD